MSYIRYEQAPEQQFELGVLDRTDLSHAMDVQVSRFEEQFHVGFESITKFPQDLLSVHHRIRDREANEFFTFARVSDSIVLDNMAALTEIANLERPLTDEERDRYRAALVNIYHRLPLPERAVLESPSTLVVGIEREGAALAEALGCLSAGHGLRPHAKRIPFDGGLLVAIKGVGDLVGLYERAVIFDGAIASGATLMALVNQIRPHARSFEIFSVHATAQGVQAIADFAKALGVPVRLVVGHETDGLNDDYYATGAGDTVVVGDLGDTICPLPK